MNSSQYIVIGLFLFEFWMIAFLLSLIYLVELPPRLGAQHVNYSFILFLLMYICMCTIIYNNEKLKFTIRNYVE